MGAIDEQDVRLDDGRVAQDAVEGRYVTIDMADSLIRRESGLGATRRIPARFFRGIALSAAAAVW
jgi:hypothetical protein